MISEQERLERRRTKRRRRRFPWRPVLVVVGVVCAFGIGLAVGEALHDNPKPGGSITSTRPLRPLPLAPARETVTVTVRR